MQSNMNLKLVNNIKMRANKYESCELTWSACVLCAVTNGNTDCLET